MKRRPHAICSGAGLLLLAMAGFAGCSIPVDAIPQIADCEKAGGICVPEGDCAAGGGTVPGTSACHFDTGPAECCMGSKPKPSATTCADQGGICLLASDCDPGHGYFSVKDVDCGGQYSSCCVPHALCGDMPFDCCAGVTGPIYHRAVCDDGALSCEPGFRKSLLGACSEF